MQANILAFIVGIKGREHPAKRLAKVIGELVIPSLANALHAGAGQRQRQRIHHHHLHRLFGGLAKREREE